MKAIILNDLKQTIFETEVNINPPNIEVKKADIKNLQFVGENEKLPHLEFETITYVPKHIIYEKQ